MIKPTKQIGFLYRTNMYSGADDAGAGEDMKSLSGGASDLNENQIRNPAPSDLIENQIRNPSDLIENHIRNPSELIENQIRNPDF